jgi:hypothetical protein
LATTNPYLPPQPPNLPPAPPAGPRSTGIDIIRCLTFIKDDPDWLRKLLFGSLASLLAMVLIGVPLLWGYSYRLVRRTAAGLEPPMPEWDDWGGIFMDGLKVAAVLIAHYIAVGLLLLPLAFVLWVVPGSMEDPSGLFALALFAMIAIAFVMLMLFAVYVHAAIVRMAVLDDLGEAFRPAEVVEFIRRNLGNTALAWVAFIIANFVSQFGFLLCCVGLLPATFWSVTVMFFSMGEVARLDSELGAVAAAGARA